MLRVSGGGESSGRGKRVQMVATVLFGSPTARYRSPIHQGPGISPVVNTYNHDAVKSLSLAGCGRWVRKRGKGTRGRKVPTGDRLQATAARGPSRYLL